MINSRDIKDLLPEVQTKANLLIEKCKENGIVIVVTSTYRDFESQNALYAIGRTKPGRKVTNAKSGYSYHNFRVAFDIVPIMHGKAIWNDLKLFDRVGAIGESLGLEWGGRWKSIQDRPHFQYTNGKTLVQLRSQNV